MRIATWNVNSVCARVPRLVEWLQAVRPDVVCLQETKCAEGEFPSEAVEPLGYQVAAYGWDHWNGVALLSRVGLSEVAKGLPGEPGFPHPEARAIAATCGDVRLWSVYVPNGRQPGHPHYAYKLEWLAALPEAVVGDLKVDRPFAICGDFNIAPTDADVWDPLAFANSTHVTPEERQALADLQALGLRDIVPRPLKYDRPFTYWDYRAGMFRKNFGMRIDLVYANHPFATAVRDAYVDREARKGKAPSDHAPVVVDVNVVS